MIKKLKSTVHCDRCPLLNACKVGDANLCINLGKLEGVLIEEIDVSRVNSLIEQMNKLVTECPLIRVLDSHDAWRRRP